MVRSFLAGLFRRLRQKKLPTVRVRAALPPADHPLLNSYLEAVIQAREAGDGELSLRLITAAREMGMDSDWLSDNEARALAGLGRGPEALALWLKLEHSRDQAVARLARELVQEQWRPGLQRLQQICADAGWTPDHLAGLDTESIGREAFTTAVLHQAIACREAEQPGLSLQLIHESRRLGLASPWLGDNEARALVNLDRRAEALAIWEELVRHPDAQVADQARTMVETHRELVAREQEEQLWNGIESLKRTCLELGWEPVHLGALQSRAEGPIEANVLELTVLKEVIASRDAGQAMLSLRLIELARGVGLQTPWLSDNEARALVNLGRRAEALTIWEELRRHPDASLAAMSAEMAEIQKVPVERESTLRHVDICLERGDAPEAIEVLIQAQIDDPDHPAYEAKLRKILLRDDHIFRHFGVDQALEANGELTENLVQLEIFESFLAGIEARMKPG